MTNLEILTKRRDVIDIWLNDDCYDLAEAAESREEAAAFQAFQDAAEKVRGASKFGIVLYVMNLEKRIDALERSLQIEKTATRDRAGDCQICGGKGRIEYADGRIVPCDACKGENVCK